MIRNAVLPLHFFVFREFVFLNESSNTCTRAAQKLLPFFLFFYSLLYIVLEKWNHSRLTEITVWHLYHKDEDYNVCGSYRRQVPQTGPCCHTNPPSDLESRTWHNLKCCSNVTRHACNMMTWTGSKLNCVLKREQECHVSMPCWTFLYDACGRTAGSQRR